MRRGVRLGEFSILEGVDLSTLLTAEQLGKIGEVAPELLRRPRPGRIHRPSVSLPSISARPVRRLQVVKDDGGGQRDCQACPAPCCMILAAGLTEEEAKSGKWAMDIATDGTPYLMRRYGRCVYLDSSNSCTIYDDRPVVCQQYRCDIPGREDRRIDRWLLSGGSRA